MQISPSGLWTLSESGSRSVTCGDSARAMETHGKWRNTYVISIYAPGEKYLFIPNLYQPEDGDTNMDRRCSLRK
jgi:hypothetical protein